MMTAIPSAHERALVQREYGAARAALRNARYYVETSRYYQRQGSQPVAVQYDELVLDSIIAAVHARARARLYARMFSGADVREVSPWA